MQGFFSPYVFDCIAIFGVPPLLKIVEAGLVPRLWCVGREKRSGTHCLRMLSSLRISGNLEISIKSAPLH